MCFFIVGLVGLLVIIPIDSDRSVVVPFNRLASFSFSVCCFTALTGDLLTCSTNASITVERNSVYHVWVSLFGHEQIRTKQLTIGTALAQFAKFRSTDGCHGKSTRSMLTNNANSLISKIQRSIKWRERNVYQIMIIIAIIKRNQLTSPWNYSNMLPRVEN